VPPARSVHALCRCNASRTELKHLASHSSTNMLTEAPNGLPAGEVSWFGRHALNMPPASQPQVPHAAAAPHPLERHPPPPHCNLHMTSRRGWRPQSLDVARRLAGDIHDDAPSWGGRPSPPRARPGTAVGRIVASSSKRGHAPATGDHFAGPKNWLPTLGAEPYVAPQAQPTPHTTRGGSFHWHCTHLRTVWNRNIPAYKFSITARGFTRFPVECTAYGTVSGTAVWRVVPPHVRQSTPRPPARPPIALSLYTKVGWYHPRRKAKCGACYPRLLSIQTRLIVIWCRCRSRCSWPGRHRQPIVILLSRVKGVDLTAAQQGHRRLRSRDNQGATSASWAQCRLRPGQAKSSSGVSHDVG